MFKKMFFILFSLLLSNELLSKSTHGALEKLSFFISLKGYQSASEEEKLKTLKLLSVYFKEKESESYNRIYHELLSLESLTLNSSIFSVTCHKESSQTPLKKYQCEKLVPNSIKKYALLEKEINTTLLAVIKDFEVRSYKDRGNKRFLKPVIKDLRQRISDFKKIKNDYQEGNFKEAIKKISIARALLGA